MSGTQHRTGHWVRTDKHLQWREGRREGEKAGKLPARSDLPTQASFCPARPPDPYCPSNYLPPTQIPSLCNSLIKSLSFTLLSLLPPHFLERGTEGP